MQPDWLQQDNPILTSFHFLGAVSGIETTGALLATMS